MVGESGSDKSLTGLAVMGLTDDPNPVLSGSIRYEGRDPMGLSRRVLRDVTVQAQILRLVEQIRRDHGSSIAFITHDMGVVAEVADRVMVMYLGSVVETGDTGTLFRRPAHPYTEALLSAVQAAHAGQARGSASCSRATCRARSARRRACRFHMRFPKVQGRRRVEPPMLRDVGDRRVAACHYPDG